jgi:DNA invertase Pin-like site-specific DNA recombinase
MKVAIWARVSTTEQHAENQLVILREWAERRGDTVVREFVTEDSAWQQGAGKGREFDKARAALLLGAHRAQYEAVLIWALDRLSRRGYKDLSSLMGQLRVSGCDVLSHEEPFIHALGPFGEIVEHMLSWIAEQSSQRSSQRIKAGMARARAEGRQIGGRKPGQKDKAPRERVTGEAAGWTEERKRQLAVANHRKRCPVPDCAETRAHD